MVTRKTQLKWMAAGGVFCLFGIGLFIQLRDGSKAAADTGKADEPMAIAGPPETKEPPSGNTTKPELVAPADSITAQSAPGEKIEAPTPSVKGVGLTPHDQTIASPGFACQMPPPKLAESATEKKPDPSPVPTAPPDATDSKPLVEDTKSLPPISGDAKPATPEPCAPAPAPEKKTAEPPLMPPLPTVTETMVPTAAEIKSATAPMAVKPVGLQEVAPTVEVAPAPSPTDPAPAPTAPAPPAPDTTEKSAGGSKPIATGHDPLLGPAPAASGEAIKPLPLLHPHKAAAAKAKELQPLTGTFPCSLDDKKALRLPRAVCEQLGATETLLVSPGPDQCLWLTNQAHLERLAHRLEESSAREIDVRVFKRLYFAQTEKAPLTGDGKITLSDRLAQFAGLSQDVILIGTDDHVEVWDAARWKKYTQDKSAREDQ